MYGEGGEIVPCRPMNNAAAAAAVHHCPNNRLFLLNGGGTIADHGDLQESGSHYPN